MTLKKDKFGKFVPLTTAEIAEELGRSTSTLLKHNEPYLEQDVLLTAIAGMNEMKECDQEENAREHARRNYATA